MTAMSSLLESILTLRLNLAQERGKLRESTATKHPAVDLSPLVSYLEKTDKELEKVQDHVVAALAARAKAGDRDAEVLQAALGQTRELLLDLLKMADEFE